MTAAELLGILVRQGFQLSLMRNEIKIAPSNLLTPQLREAINANYRELRSLLRQIEQRGVHGIDPYYLQPQREAAKSARWRPGDRPTNKYEALRDLYGDNPDDW